MSGTPGVSSCSKLSRFCSISGSLVLMKEPVAFPPGRFKLATKPSLTGSPATNTIGIIEVACFAATADASPPVATSTFTRRCTNSAASAGSRPYSPRAQRYSMVTFWPSKKPASPRPLRNACNTGPVSSGERALINPITGLAACCARTENGHATAVQPKSVTNSRRLIASPEAQDMTSHRTKLAYWKGLVERPGKCPLWVRSGRVQCISRCLLAPIADMLFIRNNDPRRDVKAKRFCRFEVQSCLVFGGRLHWELGGFRAAQDAINIGGGLSKHGDLVGPIRYEAAFLHKKAEGIDGR